MEFKIKTDIVLWAFLLLESILLFCFSPKYYSYSFNLFCFVQYLFSCFVYFKSNNKKNYFDFDVIFMVTYLFVMFIFPVFIYNHNPTFSFFKFDYNENLISKGSALALLGIQSYILGASIDKDKSNKKYTRTGYLHYSFFLVLLYMIFFLFILSGGLQVFINLYSKVSSSSGVSYYLLILIPALAFPCIAAWYNNIRLIKRKIEKEDIFNDKLLFFFVLIFVISFLFVGSRTLPIQFILIILGFYFMLFYNLSLFKLIPLLLLGALVMFFILLNRSGLQLSASDVDFFDIFLDLIINNRNTYMALDYVDMEGITWGKSMLVSILSPIPFMQSIVINLLGLNPTDCASSLIITKLTLGRDNNLDVGFGTNIVADLYIAFGVYGVIIGMCFLGFWVNYLRRRSYNIYCFVAYGVMLSYSIYLVRAEYFFFLRLLLWSLAILNLMICHPIVLKWKERKF